MKHACNQFTHRCYHRVLGSRPGTWMLVYWIIIIGLFITGILGWLKIGWDYEAQLNHWGNYYAPLKSPISMSAYAETINAGDSAKPKFPLADLPERERNQTLIKKIWGHASTIGLAIAKCESGYRSEATNNNTNGTQDQGVFQVNSVHGMPDMFDAVANISYAYTLYISQGTNPWTSSERCWGSN